MPPACCVGGPCGDRTHDPRIKSPLLYQLSYRVEKQPQDKTPAKPLPTTGWEKRSAPRTEPKKITNMR